jgi:hypothetical protein
MLATEPLKLADDVRHVTIFYPCEQEVLLTRRRALSLVLSRAHDRKLL